MKRNLGVVLLCGVVMCAVGQPAAQESTQEDDDDKTVVTEAGRVFGGPAECDGQQKQRAPAQRASPETHQALLARGS